MILPGLEKIKINGTGSERTVGCCYCSRTVKRSILSHIRKEHPREWEKWKTVMLQSFNSGKNPKQIMKEEFTIGGSYLFTWGVIEKEIHKMIEEGREIDSRSRTEIIRWQPSRWKPERTTVWEFRKRGDWATHSGDYRGNWSPYIPRNIIMKYTKPGDTVFDPFLGGGTTLVECRLLGRNGVGYDINPLAVKLTKDQLAVLRKEGRRQKHKFRPSRIRIENLDARDTSRFDDSSVDLICTHPPYFNSLRYTHTIESDLSRIGDVKIFLSEMEKIARGFYRILKNGKVCAILIGDVRIKGKMYPLGFRIMDRFLEAGFELIDIVIKRQFNDRSSGFYKDLYADNKCHRIAHEYLFIFRKLMPSPCEATPTRP